MSSDEGMDAVTMPGTPFKLAIAAADSRSTVEIQPGKGYVVGRGRNADIQVDDHKASRSHARFFIEECKLMVEDLGSANGTMVGETRITIPMSLRNGDVVRIGQTRIRACLPLSVSEEAQTWWDDRKDTVDAATSHPDKAGQTEQMMSGSLRSVPPVDLLQLLSHSQRNAVLTLELGSDKMRLYLQDGQVVRVEENGHQPTHPLKHLFRALRWPSGRFELTPLHEIPPGENISLPTDAILLESVQLADELSEIEADLPPLSSRLTFASGSPVHLRELLPEELDFVELTLVHESWRKVRDAFGGSDLDAARMLCSLLDRSIVKAHGGE